MLHHALVGRLPGLSSVASFLMASPLPAALSYAYGFGSLLAAILGTQLVTGLILASLFVGDADFAFQSVEVVMRDHRSGWLLRYLHANGASLMFGLLYCHVARGLLIGSWLPPRTVAWVSGTALLLVSVITAFLGYVLPFGQISLWGATVITSMVGAIPLVGEAVVHWLWAGYSVGSASLRRFFTAHYLLPFALVLLVLVHLIGLHHVGSTTPLKGAAVDFLPFEPYYRSKDLVGLLVLTAGLSAVVLLAPNILGHPDNYSMADALVTPPHIVPEWYFLPFYTVLRSVPDKLAGVILMVAAIALLAALPSFGSVNATDGGHLHGRVALPLGAVVFMTLGAIGGMPAEWPFVTMARVTSSAYFAYWFGLLPSLLTFDRLLSGHRLMSQEASGVLDLA